MTHIFGEKPGVVHKHAWVVGEHVPPRRVDAKRHGFHVGSHAIHYSTAAIEGMRVQAGADGRRRILFPWEHATRLIGSGETIGVIEPNTGPAPDQLIELMRETALANWSRLDPRYPMYLRPWLGEASCALGVGSKDGWLAMVMSRDLTPYLGARAETGVTIWAPGPQTFCRADRRCGFPHAKWSGNYGGGYLWKNRGKAFNVDEVLQYDLHGHVAETTGSNIFVVINDCLVLTPPLDCVLDGINRRRAIQILEALDYEVQVSNVCYEDLLKAQEIFLTGTWSGIVPVARLLIGWPEVTEARLKRLTMTPGPVTQRVRALHTAIINCDPGVLPWNLEIDPRWWLEL